MSQSFDPPGQRLPFFRGRPGVMITFGYLMLTVLFLAIDLFVMPFFEPFTLDASALELYMRSLGSLMLAGVLFFASAGFIPDAKSLLSLRNGHNRYGNPLRYGPPSIGMIIGAISIFCLILAVALLGLAVLKAVGLMREWGTNDVLWPALHTIGSFGAAGVMIWVVRRVHQVLSIRA